MGIHKITEKENALRTILRTGEPEWISLGKDAIETIFPSAVKEYPESEQAGVDWFGVCWSWDEATHAHCPDARVSALVEDITEWRDIVKLPDLDAIDWKAAAEKDLAGRDRENKLIRIFCVMGPFERMNFILGMENALVSMYEEPEEYKALIEKITDHKVKLLEKLIEAYQPDEILFHDDLGSQNGPLISLDMYREFLKPCHQRISEVIRSHGVIYTHHSCGCMEAFIDEMIDNGVQMINPLQSMNNWEAIAEKYAGKVCFNVNASSLSNYEDATEEDIRKETHRVIDAFGPYKNVVVDWFISNRKCFSNMAIIEDEIKKYREKFN